MKEQHTPIKINVTENQYIYYANSEFLNKLRFYPIALVVIFVIFLFFMYSVFPSSSISDKNKLWSGMAKEVFWPHNTSILYVILMGATLAMFFYDALGLGLFTITGVQIGLQNQLDNSVCILLGTVTGVFGEVLRDVVVNKIPVYLRKKCILLLVS